MAKALTAAALEKIKADPDKRLEIPDGLLTGLYFVVQPSGKKSWAVRYRAEGKPRKFTLGTYPAHDLSKARQEAKETLQRVQKGGDPAAVKQAGRRASKDGEAADRQRFVNVLRTFLARYAKPKNRSWKETARTLGLVPDKARPDAIDDPKSFVAVKGSIVGKWGHRPLADIGRSEVIALLDDTVDRGAPILANRTLAALRKLYNWSIERDLVETSPCDRIKPPAAEKSRDRVLSNDELQAFWKASQSIGWPFGPLFQMLVLTGQRRDEVNGVTWRELDLPGKLWTIPRERVKTDKAHEVPLNSPALSLLESLPRIAGAGYVFTTTGKTPVSGFSKAKDALDAKMLAILQADDADAVLPPWRLHDIRRTAASGMARLGINLPVIEKILNHTSGSFGGIVGVYQRHEFAIEKKHALVTWGNFVTNLIDGQAADNNVVVRHRERA